MKRALTISLLLLPYLFVFIASLYVPTDPDLGWHLKYGEYFFRHHQLLRDNMFSTMMPNYHWVNGTWGTDIITYVLYKTGGFFALTLAGACIVTLTFYFVAKAGKLTFLSQAILFPLFIFLLSPVNNNSFRGQQLSYLFLSILLFLLSKYKPFTKKFFLIPLLFLLWCNIHEEAFLFLALFGFWVTFVFTKDLLASYSNKKHSPRKENLSLVGILMLSFLATIINPFGLTLQINALSYLGNNLVTHITEYEPYTLFSLNWCGQIAVSSLLIICFVISVVKRKLTKYLPLVVTAAFFLILGFIMRRYLWPAYYISFLAIPLLLPTNQQFINKYKMIIATTISVVFLVIIIVLKAPFTQFVTMSWNEYCSIQEVPCSPKSAEYLQTHHIISKIFSYYDWGGWLIWNYPDIKPSIDGRMTEWRDDTGYSASADYATYENAQKSIDTSPYSVVYLPNDNSPLVAEVSALVQQKKWKEVYEDRLSAIVVRVKTK